MSLNREQDILNIISKFLFIKDENNKARNIGAHDICKYKGRKHKKRNFC